MPQNKMGNDKYYFTKEWGNDQYCLQLCRYKNVESSFISIVSPQHGHTLFRQNTKTWIMNTLTKNIVVLDKAVETNHDVERYDRIKKQFRVSNL